MSNRLFAAWGVAAGLAAAGGGYWLYDRLVAEPSEARKEVQKIVQKHHLTRDERRALQAMLVEVQMGSNTGQPDPSVCTQKKKEVEAACREIIESDKAHNLPVQMTMQP